MTDQPGFRHHRVGDLLVTTLNDGTLELPLETMTGIAPAEASAMLVARFQPPVPIAPVHAYLIRGRGRTVLVDTGGGGMAPTVGRLLPNLRAAGVEAAEIDLVLLTHLHSDHFGGLADREGTAVFPNAELALAEPEAAHWLDGATEAEAARAALAPYGSRTRRLPAGEVVPGISLVPLPGHTPGHSGFLVADGADALLIWGDVMHVPSVQATRPDVSMVFDTDPEQAAATRRRVLDMAAADRLAVAGMHLDFPGLVRVLRTAAGYELVPERWSPTV